MFASVIWNRHRPLYISARWVRPVYFSRSAGDTEGNVWKCRGIPTSLIAAHSGSHCGCHIGSMSHEHESSMPLKPSLATRWTTATAPPMSPDGRFAGRFRDEEVRRQPDQIEVTVRRDSVVAHGSPPVRLALQSYRAIDRPAAALRLAGPR